MTGFELGLSSVRSFQTVNSVTTSAQKYSILLAISGVLTIIEEVSSAECFNEIISR